MTPDQQYAIASQQIVYAFYASIVVGVIQVIGLLFTYLKASSTHLLVNSELAQFKELLAKDAARGVVDARAEGRAEGSKVT